MADLHARTRLVDHDVDLLAAAGAGGFVFERERVGLSGRGRATHLDVTLTQDPAGAVADLLATITVDDEVGRPGTGPVAFAAAPFDRDGTTTFTIPSVVHGRDADGTCWRTTIGPPGADLPDGDTTPESPAEARPSAYGIEPTLPAADWCDLVALATSRIAAGDLEKVVLARELVVTADADLPRHRLLRQLRHTFPGCYLFAVGPMVGASPELLVARTGDRVRAHPMAGTAPRGGDPTTDARLAASLLASAKDRAEHQITIDMVWEALLPFCSYVDSEPEPSVVGVANVQHLASFVEGRLSHPPASVIELVAALHPTPAVAGWPVAPTLAFLDAHEGIDRATYAGPVGWVDGGGNGAFAVGIRSALVDGRVARLFAGVGVVADSDPALELAETEAKFQAVLSAIVRP